MILAKKGISLHCDQALASIHQYWARLQNRPTGANVNISILGHTREVNVSVSIGLGYRTVPQEVMCPSAYWAVPEKVMYDNNPPVYTRAAPRI